MHLLMPDALSGWTGESRTALRSTCPSEGKLTFLTLRNPTKNVFAGNIMAWALRKLVQLCLLPSSAPALWLSNEI
ncbi:hypothetical protein ACKLNR_013214 [Fusarium oxysporum f. sp. zingiberi]